MDDQTQQLLSEGSVLLKSGKAEEALLLFQSAQDIEPSNEILPMYAGVALHELGRYEEAVSSYRRAIELAPNMGEAFNNLGNSLMALSRFAEAAESFSKASLLLSSSPIPLAAMATALQSSGRIAEAEAACRHALLIDPFFAEAHWNLSLNLLLQGRYAEGWQEYEWRWQKPDFTSPCRHKDVPQWDGSQLNGRTILLHAEQGFGDAIQFVRYAALVAGRGGTVVLECHPQLVSLFHGMEGVKSVVPFGAPLPAFSCQAPLLSLPYIFGTTLQTIPALIPYLSISADYREKWAALIPSHLATIRVGLVWAGSSIHRNDSLRSLAISVLEPLAGGLEHVTLFSLQIGDAKHQLKRSSLAARTIDLSDKIENFADTAGLLEQLDLVITIDSAVAHLAGALGKLVYLLVPFAPDWRWLLERSDSPWYPTLQIVRQKQPVEWGEVITRVRAALEIQQKIL